MYYKARREIFNPYTNDRLGNFGAYYQYKLIDDEKIAGEFFYKNIISYFSIDVNQYHIPTENPLFQKPNYQILNVKTGTSIGTFKISSWRDFFYAEIGTLEYSSKIYTYKRGPLQTIEAPLFKSTREVATYFYLEDHGGSIMYEALYNMYDTESSTGYRPHSDFNMNINSTIDDKILLYAGLFLIEKFWKIL